MYRDTEDILRGIRDAEEAERSAALGTIQTEINNLKAEEALLIAEGGPIKARIAGFEEQIQALRIQYHKQVGTRLLSISDRLGSLNQLALRIRRGEISTSTRRAASAAKVVERIHQFGSVLKEIKPQMMNTADSISHSDDSTSRALGEVAKAVLSGESLSQYLPFIIEEGIEHYRERNNGERVIVGENPGVRLIFLQDGNFAVVHHLWGVQDAADRVFESVGDPQRNSHVHMVGLITGRAPDDSITLDPFLILKTDTGAILHRVRPDAPGLPEVTSRIGEILSAGNISLKVGKATFSVPSPLAFPIPTSR